MDAREPPRLLQAKSVVSGRETRGVAPAHADDNAFDSPERCFELPRNVRRRHAATGNHRPDLQSIF